MLVYLRVNSSSTHNSQQSSTSWSPQIPVTFSRHAFYILFTLFPLSVLIYTPINRSFAVSEPFLLCQAPPLSVGWRVVKRLDRSFWDVLFLGCCRNNVKTLVTCVTGRLKMSTLSLGGMTLAGVFHLPFVLLSTKYRKRTQPHTVLPSRLLSALNNNNKKSHLDSNTLYYLRKRWQSPQGILVSVSLAHLYCDDSW